MRIAYVAHVSGGDHSGVLPKIAAQIRAWRIHGHRVEAFVMTRDDPAVWRASIPSSMVLDFGGPLSRLSAISGISKAVRDFDPDLVYLRYFTFYPPMLAFLGRGALVVEINTDDVAEFALGSRIRSTYNALTRHWIMGRAQAMVFVTPELSASESFRGFRAAHAAITNGVELSGYPELPLPTEDRPRLAFVGSAGQPWQGFDKVVRLARLKPGWRFDIVGASDPGGSPHNVSWHGSLDRSGVLYVLAHAHVGIGTLALHRKGLDAASPLKVREYLAVGLPVLYAYHDPDLVDLSSLTMPKPNSETNVEDELQRIDGFVEASTSMRVPRSRIMHIDVSAKETQRLRFFESVVSGSDPALARAGGSH